MLTADPLLSCFCFRSLPLRLYPDKHSHIFHPQAVIEFNGTLQNLDTSHIYIGHVEGMSKSEPVDFIRQDVSHGCIINNLESPRWSRLFYSPNFLILCGMFTDGSGVYQCFTGGDESGVVYFELLDTKAHL